MVSKISPEVRDGVAALGHADGFSTAFTEELPTTKILTVKSLQLLQSEEWIGKEEPYILTLCYLSESKNGKDPIAFLNDLTLPKTNKKIGKDYQPKYKFPGQGLMLVPPAYLFAEQNDYESIKISILVAESDKRARKIGAIMSDFNKDFATPIIEKLPESMAKEIAIVGQTAIGFIARIFELNKDDTYSKIKVNSLSYSYELKRSNFNIMKYAEFSNAAALNIEIVCEDFDLDASAAKPPVTEDYSIGYNKFEVNRMRVRGKMEDPKDPEIINA